MDTLFSHSKLALVKCSHLLWLSLFLYSTSICCFAVDTIYPNQQISDGQTIISAGNVFELGFFSPNGSTARYVGIWYREYGRRVVWVANRENPLMDSSGIMMIGSDGNLVIFGGNDNTTVWSTQANVTSQNTTVVLTDIGNLVLRENKPHGLEFWQSFNHPSETWLPKMKVGVDTRSGVQISISSWKSLSNPSRGDFVEAVDPTEPPQFVIWNNNNGSRNKHYRSGLWNGRSFTGLRFMSKDYVNGYTMSADDQQQGKLYFSIASFQESQPRIVYINPSGAFELLDWNVEKMEWTFSEVPNSPCDYYGTCGPFGKCNDDQNEWSNVCDCFTGYEPKNIGEWDKGNWKGGCVRKEKFRCERNSTTSMDDIKEDGFMEFQKINLPDLPNLLKNSPDKDSCRDSCLRNCSCTAYSYTGTMGCLIWIDDLIDIQSYITKDSGEKLYLRLSYSELGTGGKRLLKGFGIAIIIASTGLVGLSLLLTYIFCRWRNKRVGRGSSSGGFIKSWHFCSRRSVTDKNSVYATRDDHRYDFRRGDNSEVRVFSLKDIQIATDFFSAETKLGEGGFGSVYKGILPNEQQIAVKRLSRSSGQGLREFENEVKLISKLQHRNLVNLIGFCIQEEEKLLAYEYMPNKRSSSDDETLLNWSLRYDIIEGIARGVVYLHRDSRLKIIHRDLKTSNILLDEEMNPKISDFGMARIFCGNQDAANTNRVVGTYGYMSPEYAMHGKFSEKSDVFSFGVVLLEIVTGSRSSSFLYDMDSVNFLPSHAWQLWNEEKSLELLDQRLVNSCSYPSQVAKCVHVGLLCVQDKQDDRPTMETILSMLINDNVFLPIPKKPVFNITAHKEISSTERPTVFSGKSMTSSFIEGR